MPLALLLSPDDQAVAAITSVLEEMSVTCERPLDGASAAQKLNSNRFDLVLVDCENLAAAKLIFDVCRNRKGGSHPVPVAVVDGRAGLPTAFRLGAELILTKPVAKDQARVTIRTAISRVRREESTRSDAVPATAHLDSTSPAISDANQSAEPATDEAAAYVAPEGRAFAAAVGAPTPALFSEPALSSSEPTMAMSTAVAEPEPAQAEPAAVATKGAAASHPASSLFASTESEVAEPKELKEKTTQVVGEKQEEKTEPKIQTADAGTAASGEKITASEEKSEQKKTTPKASKSHGRVITLFVLLVACGGFYAAWTYEPGFQALVKTQIENVLRLIGKAPQQSQPVPVLVKPAAQTPKPSAGVPVQVAPMTPQATQPNGTDLSVNPSASPVTASSPATTQPAATAATPATGVGANASKAAVATPAQPPATPMTKPGVTRIDLSPGATAEPAKRTPPPSKPPQPEH